MARFSGTQLPQATYNASADKSGQFIAQGISQAGAALGQGLKEYIQGNVKKKRDDEQISVMTDFLWDQGTAQKWGVKSKEELAKMGHGARGFGGYIKMYNDKQAQEVQDLQYKQLQLQHSTLLKQTELNTLRQQNIATGQDLTGYIDSETKKNHGPDGLPAEEFARQNPILFQLIQAEAAGADPTQVKALYDRLVTPKLSFSQKTMPGGETVTIQTDGQGNQTIVPKSSMTTANDKGATRMVPIYDENGVQIAHENMSGSTKVGPTIYYNEQSDALMQAEETASSPGSDTIENVYIRKAMEGQPSYINPGERAQLIADARVKADKARVGFSTSVSDKIKDNDTISDQTNILIQGQKTLDLLDVAQNKNSVAALKGAIKSFIKSVDPGVVTGEEFEIFTTSGLAGKLLRKVMEDGLGSIADTDVDNIRVAMQGLVDTQRPKLVENINKLIDAEREIYKDIPAHQQDKLIFHSASQFVDPESPASDQQVNKAAGQLPEGMSRNADGRIIAELDVGDPMDVANEVRKMSNLMKSSPNVGYPEIRAALVRGKFSPEVVNYIINEIEALEKE
tara:strand:- start:4140 stop:5840 length:1701 start_codon:yes stop_codon:yes gene_type:complete